MIDFNPPHVACKVCTNTHYVVPYQRIGNLVLCSRTCYETHLATPKQETKPNGEL